MKKLLLLMFILLIPVAFASNPQHHLHLEERVCTESNPTEIRNIACNNFDAFVIGNIMTDWTVPKYFTEFVKYSNSHSPSLCVSLISLAATKRQLAFAYGSCTHMIQDAVSHNRFVPPIIAKTALTNELVHALAEETENDILISRDSQLRGRLDNLLLGFDGNAFEEFVPFYKQALQQNSLFQDENIEANIDFLMTQIVGKKRYDHGFGTAFVVPVEIWITIGLVFLLSSLSMVLLLFKRKKTLFNWITMVALLLPIIVTSLMFYGLFSGNLFNMYQSMSSPITKLLPLGDWESLVDLQVQNTIQFFNQGSTYILTIDDPTGIEELQLAGEQGILARWIAGILLMALLALLIYQNLRRKKK